MDRRTVVLGVGNTLLADEGAGVHAVRALAQSPGADVACGVELVDAGTLSFSLAVLIEDAARLIVIDAAQLGEQPGAIRLFEGAEMDCFLGRPRRSPHEVGLIDLLATAQLGGHLPAQRALVGIQPERVDWGELPSQAVAAAIPIACGMVRDLIARWRQ